VHIQENTRSALLVRSDTLELYKGRREGWGSVGVVDRGGGWIGGVNPTNIYVLECCYMSTAIEKSSNSTNIIFQPIASCSLLMHMHVSIFMRYPLVKNCGQSH
jgi:hypothetical protein